MTWLARASDVLLFAVMVLLAAAILRLEYRLRRMAEKTVSYELFLTPQEVLDLARRDPLKIHFARRTTDLGVSEKENPR